MSLAITVGIVQMFEELGETEGAADYRERLDDLSQALEHDGVRGYREPATVTHRGRRYASSFSASNLQALRRCYALMATERPVTPAADWKVDRALIDDVAGQLFSHLLCHDDSDGFYVPVHFADPKFLTTHEEIVGSSQALLGELRDLAPHLGVRLEPDGSLSDAEAERVFQEGGRTPFAKELVAWLALHEAAVVSIASGAAIAFH